MPYCAACRRSDIADHWEFCPRCGSGLTAPPAESDRSDAIKEVLVDVAVSAAQHFVRGRLQQKFGPFAQIIDQALGAVQPPPPDDGYPEWYETAVSEQQPTMDPIELARRQAQEITDARTASEMARSAIETAKSITATIARSWD